jgi:lysozyme family protein
MNNIPAPILLPGKQYTFDNLKAEYTKLWDMMEIRPERMPEIERVIDMMMRNRSRYNIAVQGTEIPWYFIAMIHVLEASANFKRHLHNGDLLTARTVNVPAGRPIFAPRSGGTIYTWEESAQDAIIYTRLNLVKDWTIAKLLYRGEAYNGFGYRRFKVHTPYNWSYTNIYTKGRYVRDGVFDPETITRAPGFAPVLKVLIDRKIIEAPALV